MTLYPVLLSLHVVVAILGVGQVAGIAVVASSMTVATPELWGILSRLVRGASISLAVMFLTGAYFEAATGGAFHRTWWFRISVLLFFGIGAFLGRTRGALRKPTEVTRQLVARNGWILCTLVAIVAVLMESKPW
jgi:hypothetical protein